MSPREDNADLREEIEGLQLQVATLTATHADADHFSHLMTNPVRPVTTQPILDGGTSLGGALYSASDATRRERSALSRATSVISSANVVAQREDAKRARRQSREEAAAAAYLPKRGERGEHALRSYRRLRVQPHKATSDVVAGAYPFLAESGLGPEGVLIGQDAWSGAGFVYDPWVLYSSGVITNPNCLLAGVVGRGKSTLA